MRVLVVGGAGYVGSHAVRECLRCGIDPVVFDNYLTGSPDAVVGIERISGDLLDPKSIRSAFNEHRFDAVLHFAGLSYATESVRQPAQYYRNNIAGTLNLLHTLTHLVYIYIYIISSNKRSTSITNSRRHSESRET